MDEQHVMEILETSGAVLRGHFRLTSGKHSNGYVQCAKIFQYPSALSSLCSELAAKVSGHGVNVVASPAIGGVLLGHEMARALSGKIPVKSIFAERESGALALRRGFSIEPGDRVLVVEDVVTTGGTVREVVQLVSASGGTPVAVASLVDRSRGTASFGLPFYSLVRLDLDTFEPDSCPLCRAGVELYTPGSRWTRKG